MDRQFYPTPAALAEKAVAKFKNRSFTRVLEPSAGRADLLEPLMRRHCRASRVDCIEIDLDNQAILRENGFNVIDADFMAFEGRGAMYSHILMNPPFNAGVDHVLKAWHMLFDGELVAIINAESIANPCTAKRRLLVSLIADHGSVEFIEDAFMDPDTKRKTPVRIALIHLERKNCLEFDYLGDLKRDEEQLKVEDAPQNMLALPQSSIKNTVVAFNAAVEAMKAAVIADEKARYYSALVGLDLRRKVGTDGATSVDTSTVTERVGERYATLKESAWRTVLRATEFTSRLSSAAQTRLEAQMAEVSRLEFTVANIQGLLAGLVNQRGQMQTEMVCDVFDEITKFHSSGNRAYYRGWKSNDKHREGAFRIKMTRFILPYMNSSFGELGWEAERKLADFDKVFALLDGEHTPGESLAEAISRHKQALTEGQRIATKYFDLRYYPGAGTLHFFPRRKDLIDRMNRLVGRERQWLPDEKESVDPRFWGQYDKAEKVTAQMEQVMKRHGMGEHEIYHDGKARLIHAEACEDLGIELPALAFDDNQTRAA